MQTAAPMSSPCTTGYRAACRPPTTRPAGGLHSRNSRRSSRRAKSRVADDLAQHLGRAPPPVLALPMGPVDLVLVIGHPAVVRFAQLTRERAWRMHDAAEHPPGAG